MPATCEPFCKLHEHCPACGGRRFKATDHWSIKTCTRCNAIFGKCYLGESYGIVLPYLTDEDVPTERTRYYDFDCIGSKGLTRRHGWFDPATKLITQVG